MTEPAGRILLVEDTPTQAEVAKAMLATMGHEVRHAATGAEALAIAQDWPPDAVLVDLDLPDFSGFEVMRRLKARGSKAALIVLTVNNSVDTVVEAMREGAMDFIAKPYGKARLKVTLDNALENRALRAELTAVKEQLSGFVAAAASPPPRRHGGDRASPLRYAIGALIFLAAVLGLFFIAGFSF